MDLRYSFQSLSQILQDFHSLTNLRIALMDQEFHEVLAYPSRLCDFCREIRQNDSINKKCLQCDYKAFSHCRHTKQAYLYQCHIGLTEIIVPILSNGHILGYLMCGQILQNTSDSNKPLLPQKAMEMLHPVSEAVVYSIYRMLQLLSTHIADTNKILHNTDNLSYRLDQYILKHLPEELSLEQLASVFHYRKTTFCSLVKKLYGTGIMHHVRQLRIQTAKQYLSSTNLPIYEIAALVGIHDYNYFTKIFKAETNCTPKEFRKNSISQ